MSMSAALSIGELWFSKGYDVAIDNQTSPGFIYFGISEPKNGSKILTSEPKWAIFRCKITNTNKLSWFRWANGVGMQFNQVWNANGLDDVYAGTATF